MHLKMLTSQDLFYKDAINGEIVYDIDLNSYYIYNDGTWHELLLDSDKQRKHSTICPRCGAPCSPYQMKCDYCEVYFKKNYFYKS